MKIKKFWVDLSLLNLCVVAILGLTLRSKILFPLPFIDYDRLLEAHSHFAFGGWVTLALLMLMVRDFLPESPGAKSIYHRMFAGIAASSWAMLFTYSLGASAWISDLFSTLFILVTYLFSWRFIMDILRARLNRTIALLAISSVICLVISSAGSLTLAYLFASKSVNVILYKDALYTYLHFQYNGFFSLTVFALLFQKSGLMNLPQAARSAYRFSVFLIASLVPSLFLTFLWQNPGNLFRAIAIIGSILLLLCLFFFIKPTSYLFRLKPDSTLIGSIILFALSMFALKTFLQSLTIFPLIGTAVFGDRPIIIGFLHLVFLGFVSLFILAYFAQTGFLDTRIPLTRIALVVFTIAVALNELILMTQGLGAMFIKSSNLFPWLLWIVSIGLLTGALLIVWARMKSASAEVLR